MVLFNKFNIGCFLMFVFLTLLIVYCQNLYYLTGVDLFETLERIFKILGLVPLLGFIISLSNKVWKLISEIDKTQI